MAAKTYYYARVSSASQNLARQIEAFRRDGADDHDIITEKRSGKNMERPEYQAIKDHMLRSGDTLVVMSLDRLGRNKQEVKEELDYYRKHNIRVRILDLPTSNFKPGEGQEWILDMVNNIIIEVLASQAEQERLTLRKRQAEGIAIARSEGKYKGRQPCSIDEQLFASLYDDFLNRKISKTDMAKQLEITRPTLDRILKKRQLMRKDSYGKLEYSQLPN